MSTESSNVSSDDGNDLDEVCVSYSNIKEEPEENDVDSEDSKSNSSFDGVILGGIGCVVFTKVLCICAILCCCLLVVLIASIIVIMIYKSLSKSHICPNEGSIVFIQCIDAGRLALENPNFLISQGKGISKINCLNRVENRDFNERIFGMTNSSHCFGFSDIVESLKPYKVNETSSCGGTRCLPFDTQDGNLHVPPIHSIGKEFCGDSTGRYMSIFQYEEIACKYSS